MRALGVALLLLVTGCGYTQVSANAGALQLQGGRPLAFVIFGTAILATADSSEPRSSLADWTRSAPAMQPDRAINEQDCTKPIDLSGNLRCR